MMTLYRDLAIWQDGGRLPFWIFENFLCSQ